MLRGLRSFNTKSIDVDRLYRNLVDFATQFTNKPVLDGLLLKDIALTSATATTVDHKLGRAIQGWVVADINANANVWALEVEQVAPTKTLVLNASANCTTSLYVF